MCPEIKSRWGPPNNFKNLIIFKMGKKLKLFELWLSDIWMDPRWEREFFSLSVLVKECSKIGFMLCKYNENINILFYKVNQISKCYKQQPCPVWVVLCSPLFLVFMLVKPNKTQTKQQKKGNRAKNLVGNANPGGPHLCGGGGTAPTRGFCRF